MGSWKGLEGFGFRLDFESGVERMCGKLRYGVRDRMKDVFGFFFRVYRILELGETGG